MLLALESLFAYVNLGTFKFCFDHTQIEFVKLHFLQRRELFVICLKCRQTTNLINYLIVHIENMYKKKMESA